MNEAAAPDLWRLAALTMMDRERLAALLADDDAADWVAAAARCGLPEAQLRLGRMLLSGEGAPPDAAAAHALFVQAAQHGNIEARNMLGRCCENGWGTAVDYPAAACHYRIAAEAGLDWAQYNLGHMLLSGAGVPRDQGAALRWYLRAAKAGHVRAMNLVGRCCEEGWGMAPNCARARAWYRRSAEGGYFRGAYNYASILAGEGKIEEAAQWFRRALDTAPEPTRSLMRRSLERAPLSPME